MPCKLCLNSCFRFSLRRRALWWFAANWSLSGFTHVQSMSYSYLGMDTKNWFQLLQRKWSHQFAAVSHIRPRKDPCICRCSCSWRRWKQMAKGWNSPIYKYTYLIIHISIHSKKTCIYDAIFFSYTRTYIMISISRAI